MLSRGVTAEQLKIMDVWWRGPSWLAQLPMQWPAKIPPVDVSLPKRKGSANHSLSVEVPRKLLDPTKYSSYWKLLRVTAWIMRFRQIALRKGRSCNLTALKLETARSYWIQAVQGESFAAEFKALRENLPLPEGSKITRFNLFLDEGLIRLGGRLQFANLSREQRHQLLLDGQHHFTKLLILRTHFPLHCLGVRITLA